MNILVISDSHGRRERIEEALARQIKKPDAIIFLGDGLRDITSAEIGDIPVYAVSGNCDMGGMFCDNAPTEQCLILGEKKIFFTHGHRYGVKSTLSPLISEAAERGARILLFGHTHAPFERILTKDNEYGIKIEEPIYIMNPGSIGEYPYSFGSITVSQGGEILLSHGRLA
jgi:putative phosphoesterase